MNQEINSAAFLSPKKVDAPIESFISAMAAAAFGVSLITTDGKAGRFGLTVSAVSSVSAEPPLLLACVNRKNLLEQAITANGCFVVNLLSEQQASLAKAFAGRPEQGAPYDFALADWTIAQGLPMLQKSTASFVCDITSWSDAGTHRIFIGRVTYATHSDLPPLVYSHRNFGKFTKL